MTMTAWSRGAVGQPPLPQDDGVTGLWHSSSEAPRPASNPGDTLGEDSLAARARALLSTGQVHPGPRGHLLTWLLSRAAEHGAPAACSPVLPLPLASADGTASLTSLDELIVFPLTPLDAQPSSYTAHAPQSVLLTHLTDQVPLWPHSAPRTASHVRTTSPAYPGGS